MSGEDIREELFGLKRQIECAENQIKNSVELSAHNKELILRFMAFLINRQISLLRVKKYMILIRQVAIKGGKDLDTFERVDIDRIMSELRLKGRKDGRPYKPSSLNDFTTVIKIFYRFKEGMDDDETPEICKHLKKAKTTSPVTREMLVSESDVKRLIAGAENTQDKCMISLAYDDAFRPSELRGIRLKDIVKNNRGGYKLYIDGKTGKRTAFSVVSEALIAQQLNNHAFLDNPNNPFFYQVKNGKPVFMTHSRFQLMIKRVSKKVLGRKIHPYILRHSRATELTIKGVQDSKLKKFMGQSPTSRALATYQKLVDSDVEDMVLDVSGVPVASKVQERKEFVTKSCPKCGALCAPNVLICEKCSAILDSVALAIGQEIDTSVLVQRLERCEGIIQIMETSPSLLSNFEEEVRRRHEDARKALPIQPLVERTKSQAILSQN